MDYKITGKRKKKRVTNRPKEEMSIRGMALRQIIAHVTSDQVIGQRIKTGEMRKNIVEPKWKCPDKFVVEHIELETFSMELLHSKKHQRTDRVILQLHGGGYIGAMRNAYRDFACLYNEVSGGMNVLTIDYRVAPENPFPAALLDASAAYEWLLKKGFEENQIVIAGDSAGGGLALALCLYLKDHGRPLPAGIIAMSPWTDLTASGPSYNDNYESDPLFGNTRDSLIYNKDYVGTYNPRLPYISPMFGDYEGFPPMLLQVGSVEMLLSDSISVAYKAKRAGVKVRLSIYEGMFHLFQMVMRLMPESAKAWREIEYYFKILDRRNK